MFAYDCNLLIYEPALFEEVHFAAQKRLQVSDASITGTTLTSAAANFEQAQVDVGSVLLVGEQTLEVVERVDAQTLSVSRLRMEENVIIWPVEGSSLSLEVFSFDRQIASAQESLLNLLGLKTEDAKYVMSHRLMRRLTAIGALAMIFHAATSTGEQTQMMQAKAAAYRRAFQAEVESSAVYLDMDLDGVADHVQRFAVARLLRI